MQNKGRLLSLDALRGFDMAWIIGLGLVVTSFCAIFPGGDHCWVERQFHHAVGNGFTFKDFVFPLFLFMSGVSFPFSYSSQLRKGVPSSQIHLKMVKRAAMLVLLSMVHCGVLQFDPAKYRYLSVLQRIGLTGLLTSLVYVHFGNRGRLGISLVLLIGYFVLLAVWGPGVLDTLDRYLAPRGYFAHDPFEVHDIPLSFFQIPLCMMGMFAGDIVRGGDRAPQRLSLIGAVLAVAGLLLHYGGFPINKNLATPASTLFTGGLCFLVFAAFHYLVDVKGISGWTMPFRVIGVNSIAAYLAPSILCLNAVADFFFSGFAAVSGVPAFVTAVGRLLVVWLFLWFLDRHRVYFKV